MNGRLHSVYIARGTFDGERGVLYVGSTSRGMTRFHEHAGVAMWWESMTSTSWRHYKSREAALAAERRLIRELRPMFN